MAESIVFKKYYNSLQYVRVAEIYCPEVILNEEYTDEKGIRRYGIIPKYKESIVKGTINTGYVDGYNITSNSRYR